MTRISGYAGMFRGPDYPAIIFRGDKAYEHISPANIDFFKSVAPNKEQITEHGQTYIETINKWKK
jgi:hypothetical protein